MRCDGDCDASAVSFHQCAFCPAETFQSIDAARHGRRADAAGVRKDSHRGRWVGCAQREDDSLLRADVMLEQHLGDMEDPWIERMIHKC